MFAFLQRLLHDAMLQSLSPVSHEWRQVLRQRGGFSLVETMIATVVSLTIMATLATFMMVIGQHALILAQAADQRQMSEARLAQTLQHLDAPEPGVTVTRDENVAEDAPCQLYRVTTVDTFHRTHEAWASRGCVNQ